MAAPVGFLLYDPYTRPLSTAGKPQAGAYYVFYLANTTTPTNVYSDAACQDSLGNTVTSDASGAFSTIYLNPAIEYRVQLYSATNVLLRDTLYFLPPQQPTVVWGGTDSGVANAYVVSVPAALGSVPDGLTVLFIPSNTNSGASTLAVNGLAPITIEVPGGGSTPSGALTAGEPAEAVYSANAGVFYLISSSLTTGAGVGTFGGETTLASASTVDLGTASAHTVRITGTTTITSFGSSAQLAAPLYSVRFSGDLILTNGAALVLPTAANIDVSAGDWLFAMYLGSGNWVVLAYQPAAGGALGTFRTGESIASASTTDLGTVQSQVVEITGTTTINSFGASANTNTPLFFLLFAAAVTLTYNATSMVLPGGASITTAAGDSALAIYLGSGNWQVVQYTVAANGPGGGSGGSGFQTGTVTTTSNAGTVNVSFSPAFATSCDFVGLTLIAPSGVGSSNELYVISKSAAGFSARLASASNVAVDLNWYAVGH